LCGTVTGMSPESNSQRPAGVSRARRADADRNRAALLAAAARLFDERSPEVPLDEIAKAAGVANATLYRHFATRAELILTVYAQEVADLVELAERLQGAGDPDRALTDWLRAFVRHVAGKRDLALALPDEPAGRRGALFAEWHAAMRTAAEQLLERAQAGGTVRGDVRASDLLALTAGIAMTGLPADALERLLDLARDGYSPPSSPPTETTDIPKTGPNVRREGRDASSD
jgi:AcrR family transcriptional regulator